VELRALGETTIVPSLAGFEKGARPFLPRMLRTMMDQVQPGPAERVVLVAHSGAGVLLPYLAEALQPTRVSAVFADAALPAEPGPGAITDSGFLPFLRDIASDGILPPWPQWWSSADLSPLYPDDDTRRIIEAEAPALPLAFFEEQLPETPPSWRFLAKGYLRFSEAYEALANEARRRGWPVRDLPGEHLHMLVQPRLVAEELRGLADDLAGSA
jgi:hypothetical protein